MKLFLVAHKKRINVKLVFMLHEIHLNNKIYAYVGDDGDERIVVKNGWWWWISGVSHDQNWNFFNFNSINILFFQQEMRILSSLFSSLKKFNEFSKTINFQFFSWMTLLVFHQSYCIIHHDSPEKKHTLYVHRKVFLKKSKNHSTWKIRFISHRKECFFIHGKFFIWKVFFSCKMKKFICSNWQKTCMIYYVSEKCWENLGRTSLTCPWISDSWMLLQR